MITNPPARVTSQPLIQLQGFISSDLAKTLLYQVFNQNHVQTSAGEGLATDRYFDQDIFDFTTNYFTCFDLPLNPGTNTIVLRGTDRAGYTFATNFVIVFTTVGDTNPPVFKLRWLHDGMSISGSQFDLDGPCDDPTAVVTALLFNDQGVASHLNGFVERNGCLWVEEVPVTAGRNYITVVATDAAGNSSFTNLMFSKSSMTLYMDPVPDPNKLWQPKITVTGYCSLTNCVVSVNRVKARMKPDGHWVADDVPVNSPNGGNTASFDLTTDDYHDNLPTTNSWFPTICGEPMDNKTLSAGVSFGVVATNEYNHYPIDLGLTNGSGTAIPHTWILPEESTRYSLHLYDQTNKEVPLGPWVSTGQPLATGLNIHHLGKNELAHIDGIISFLTNSTVRIASLNLDQLYPSLRPGNYRLEIVARMFKIANDGQLLPFEFPSISAAIKIIDQPSETVFYLNNLHRQGKLSWGPERNSFRIGITHNLPWTRIEDANHVQIFVQNTGANDYHDWNLLLPDSNEQCDIALYDSAGEEVPKTALGKRLGKPLSRIGQDLRPKYENNDGWSFGIPRPSPIKPVYLSARSVAQCGEFNLNDYFEIKTTGNYRLTYQQRFYLCGTNTSYIGLSLPTVVVPLNVTYIPGQ